MTYKQMDTLIKDTIFPAVLNVRDAGQKEYARSEDDVFANFKRVASFTGDSKEKALLTYLIKHIDGIGSYINGHKSQREHVTGRILDAICYLILLWGMCSQNKKEKE